MSDTFDLEWKELESTLETRFGKLPDLQSIIYLIGINEVGFVHDRKFTKEQKQDLMHVATCILLSQEDYYVFDKNDDEGWPHFKLIKELPEFDLVQQEEWLKHLIVRYFANN